MLFIYTTFFTKLYNLFLREIILKHLTKILIILFLVGFVSVSHGQNLVPNPSFENYINCPNGSSQIDSCQLWFEPSTGTPDYFNSCFTFTQPWTSNVDIPQNFMGYQVAKSGTAYTGLLMTDNVTWNGNYREYIGVKLNASLVSGTKYYFSCWISLADSSRYAIGSGLGVYFSNDSIYQSNFDTINVVPNIINPSGNFIVSKSNWVPFQGTYIASGGENYLYLGNFDDYSVLDTLFVNNGGGVANNNLPYYYLDDVCLSLDSSLCFIPTSVNYKFNNNEFSIYPNPSSGVFKVYNKEIIENYSVYSAVGKMITTKNSNSKSLRIDLSDYPSGVYIINLEINSKIIRKRLIKN